MAGRLPINRNRVVNLFPSLSAERTGKAVREQVKKSRIKWEDIDPMWLSLYVHLNRELCSDIEEIEHLLPKRRERRRGREAGMGSEECDQRHLENSEKSNWRWPERTYGEREIRELMGGALEVAIRFFFQHFTYTFGGLLYIQNFGGPIGARLTMCVAGLVLQQWREEYTKTLRKASIEELMSKIYVDDNRALVKKLAPGLRFDESSK